MADEAHLLQLFDLAGMAPSLVYTSAEIVNHRDRTSDLLLNRNVITINLGETSCEYGVKTFREACDKLQHITERGTLAFYPSTVETWPSH